MDGIWIIFVLLSLTEFWYGGAAYATAFLTARAGIVHVPALVLGAAQLWVGGLFALAAGSLAREPPTLPERNAVLAWTVLMFVAVLAVVAQRRPDVEARLPDRVRRSLDGRLVILGAAIAALVLFWYTRGV